MVLLSYETFLLHIKNPVPGALYCPVCWQRTKPDKVLSIFGYCKEINVDTNKVLWLDHGRVDKKYTWYDTSDIHLGVWMYLPFPVNAGKQRGVYVKRV